MHLHRQIANQYLCGNDDFSANAAGVLTNVDIERMKSKCENRIKEIMKSKCCNVYRLERCIAQHNPVTLPFFLHACRCYGSSCIFNETFNCRFACQNAKLIVFWIDIMLNASKSDRIKRIGFIIFRNTYDQSMLVDVNDFN